MEAVELIDRRIDHVFARPGHSGQRLQFERAVLAGDADASDHKAVVCDIAW